MTEIKTGATRGWDKVPERGEPPARSTIAGVRRRCCALTGPMTRRAYPMAVHTCASKSANLTPGSNWSRDKRSKEGAGAGPSGIRQRGGEDPLGGKLRDHLGHMKAR